ncbi:hypothetical protein LMH73_022120 [Vibrio splendidus]|nr:hypothetical protein [Vibrio splendidus]MCC4882482.1 hypothetical protein [Vibrio splendidus]
MNSKILLSSIFFFAAINAHASTEVKTKEECTTIQDYFTQQEKALPYKFTDHGYITNASAQTMGEMCLVTLDIEYNEQALIDHFLVNAKGITIGEIISYVNSNHVNNLMRENFKSQAKSEYANHSNHESLIFQYNVSYSGKRINNKLVSFNIDS